jgi:hypothetical protein
MTPESVERAIQFLSEHQAKYEAQRERDRAEYQQRWNLTQKQIDDLVALNKVASHKMLLTSEQISLIAENIRGMGEEIKTLKDACRDLLDHGYRTDTRLDRLENPES